MKILKSGRTGRRYANMEAEGHVGKRYANMGAEGQVGKRYGNMGAEGYTPSATTFGGWGVIPPRVL